MRPLSASVRDGRLVIVVEPTAATSYYELAAAEDAIGAALGCEVDVVTIAMLPGEKEGEDMVTPRKPDETDAEYLARLAEPESTELRIEMARRAIEFLDMSVTLGRQGGFGDESFESWKQRSAFAYGIQSGLSLARLVIHIDGVPTLEEFIARAPDTRKPWSQSDIDAVCDAADVIVAQIKRALEALKKGDSDGR